MGAFCGQDFVGWALGEDFTVVDADDFGVEQQGLFDVVGDGECGEVAFGEVLLHAGKKRVAEGAVEAGEGFVEQDQLRVRDGEGSGERDALAFAAGEIVGHAMGERCEREEVEQLVDAGWKLAGGEGEGDVFAHGKVREEDGTLRGVG